MKFLKKIFENKESEIIKMFFFFYSGYGILGMGLFVWLFFLVVFFIFVGGIFMVFLMKYIGVKDYYVIYIGGV